MTEQRKIRVLGHLDSGRTSLTAALVRVLAHGVDVKKGPPDPRCLCCGKTGHTKLECAFWKP